MTLRTDGIVIREQTTGEQDRLVTILTRENGVIKGFVNGGRNPKNRNVSSTGLLCYSDFTIEKTKKDVYIIKEATAKEVFFSLRENITSLSLAQYFAEIAGELSPREEDAGEYLSLLLNSIFLLTNKKKDARLIKAVTELRLCAIAGYMPNLVSCCECGKFETEIMYFNLETGMLFCENCKSSDRLLKLGPGIISAMRHICFSAPEKVFSFNLSTDGIIALSDLTERYLKKVTLRNYKTLDFYKTMTDI